MYWGYSLINVTVAPPLTSPSPIAAAPLVTLSAVVSSTPLPQPTPFQDKLQYCLATVQVTFQVLSLARIYLDTSQASLQV